jgi:uncharacterized membrane protein YcaP (DUF421 family)
MYTIIHVIIGYFFLLLTVRVLARRPRAQMAPFEFVIVFLIGGIIILSSTGDDRSMTNCTCALITAGLMHRLVTTLRSKFPRFAAWALRSAGGRPRKPVLAAGSCHQSALHIDDNDVMAAAREQGVTTLSGIKYAVVERNGSISIIKGQSDSSK